MWIFRWPISFNCFHSLRGERRVECLQSKQTKAYLSDFYIEFAKNEFHLEIHFQIWFFQLKYAKNYANQIEEMIRMEIFLENKQKIKDHNEQYARGLVTYNMSLNKYSDLTPDEFYEQMMGLRPSCSMP